MSFATKILIKGNKYTDKGPDLGFLDIPVELTGGLRAASTFINLNRERASVLARKNPTKGVVCAVMGAVAEFTTEELSLQRREKIISVSGFFLDGQASKQKSIYNLIEFIPARHSDVPKPNSYRGVSGGEFWCAYYATGRKRPPQFEKLRLMGVAFYEVEKGRKLKIICHTSRIIYQKLMDKVEEHFRIRGLN